MNAALMTKPTKAIIAAATLSLLTAAGAAAQDAPVGLGAQATLSLSSYYANPPLGAVTLGGMPFTTASAVDLAGGSSASYTLSYQNPSKVSLLLNTANTAWWYEGSPIGRVTLTFANGATQNVDLVVGSNVREWAFGTDWTVDTLSDTNAANVWTGTRADDATVAAGLDMLTVQVASANTTSTLTGVAVSNTNDWGSLELRVSGVSVAYNPPATWTRPGNSGTTPAAVNSQAPDHSSSPNFAGAPTTNTASATCQPTNGDLQSNQHTGAKGNGGGGNGGHC